jgi:TetR/AcrR family tetracycline transcriptional repressor
VFVAAKGGNNSVADEPAAKRKRGLLTREVIISKAIDVIDEAGVAGLTMRKLGQALGVDAMSVYGYFENKAELLDAVVESEAQRLAAIPGPYPSDPVELIVRFGMHYRSVLLEHPNMAPLVASRPLPQQNWRATVTFGVSLFRAAGFDDPIIPLAADAMVGFTLGFIVHEAGQRALRVELGEHRAEHVAEVHRQLAELGPEHAVEAAMIRQRLDDEVPAAQFEAGLRAMLRGLKSGLGDRPE